MKILKYRTIAEVYPYLSLEAMVQLSNGNTVYANITVNDEGKQEFDTEDSHWTYTKPLTEVDFENVENYYYDLTEDEEKHICDTLLALWNSNPVFDNDYSWKDYK